MAALMSLVAVQPAPRHPLTVHILSLLHGKDADIHITRHAVLESNYQPGSGKDKLVRRNRDNQPAGDSFRRLTALCRRRRGSLVSYIQCVATKPDLLRD